MTPEPTTEVTAEPDSVAPPPVKRKSRKAAARTKVKSMATDSRVRNGTLTIDGEDFACPITSINITPSDDVGDTTETLCGDKVPGDISSSETLSITAIQDWSAAAADSLVALSWKKRGCQVTIVWSPDGKAENEWTMTGLMPALAIGGDINAQLTTDLEMVLTSVTPPTKFDYKGYGGNCTP